MANFLPLGFCFLLFFRACFAQLEQPQERVWQELQEQQQHPLRSKTPCNIQRLNAQEPTIRVQEEAGVTEFWNSTNPEFECAGVEVERKTIHQNGLLLPHYDNAPKIVYVIQGRGIQGTVIPGCAETFESTRDPGEGQYGEGGRQRSDRHQKLRRIRQGEILALPAGITHWVYNDGDTPLIFVSLIDVANEANQLDLQFRKFFLAGNAGFRQQGGQEQWGRRGQEQQPGQGEGGQRQHRNIFNGFDEKILANAFNVNPEIIRNLKGQDDQRGGIVRAENLQLSLPEEDPQEQERLERQQGEEGQYGRGGRGWTPNGLEETVCTVKLRENIAHPARADLFNPRAGRLSTVNSQTLPVLSYLRLSAEYVNLYSNAIYAPHWTINAHSALYVIRGSARIQVVGDNGNNVFDEEVRQGQLILVPQNFAVIKKAGNEGFEYIAFKTNDNAMTNSLAGRLSTIRAIPEEILANAYRMPREEVRNLKFGRQEALLLSGSQFRGRREVA